jgi:acyl carrier protein
MTRDEVLAKLQEVFNNVFVQDVVVTADLTADDVEEWDSLVHVTLVVAVERAFGIRFGVGEVEATRNAGEFADLICLRAGSK